METNKQKVLVYDDDLKSIDIIEVEEHIDSLSSEELSDYDNYLVLDKNLQEQLKEAVKKMLGEN